MKDRQGGSERGQFALRQSIVYLNTCLLSRGIKKKKRKKKKKKKKKENKKKNSQPSFPSRRVLSGNALERGRFRFRPKSRYEEWQGLALEVEVEESDTKRGNALMQIKGLKVGVGAMHEKDAPSFENCPKKRIGGRELDLGRML